MIIPILPLLGRMFAFYRHNLRWFRSNANLVAEHPGPKRVHFLQFTPQKVQGSLLSYSLADGSSSGKPQSVLKVLLNIHVLVQEACRAPQGKREGASSAQQLAVLAVAKQAALLRKSRGTSFRPGEGSSCRRHQKAVEGCELGGGFSLAECHFWGLRPGKFPCSIGFQEGSLLKPLRKR